MSPDDSGSFFVVAHVGAVWEREAGIFEKPKFVSPPVWIICPASKSIGRECGHRAALIWFHCRRPIAMKNFDRVSVVFTARRDLGDVIGNSEATVDHKTKAVKIVQGQMVQPYSAHAT